jgi:hypothetical protein
MAAVPFTQTLIFKGTSNGKVIHFPMTVSDVVGEFAVSPDGQGFVQLPSDQNYSLVDWIVVVGGTDTAAQEVFKNGLNTGLKADNKSNLNTSNFRQFATAPVTFSAGANLRLKQTA